MEVVTSIAAFVSALAALGALYFAWRTVREAGLLRREERIARLPELVAELGETAKDLALRGGNAFPTAHFYEMRRRRVAVALAALGEPPARCVEFATSERWAARQFPPAEVDEIVLAALDELSELVRDFRWAERTAFARFATSLRVDAAMERGEF